MRLVQRLKTNSPMLVREDGSAKVTEVRPVQPSKAAQSIFVTDEGMVIDARLVLPANVYPLIDVIELGSVMDVRLVQFAKAFQSIDVTEEGMETK